MSIKRYSGRARQFSGSRNMIMRLSTAIGDTGRQRPPLKFFTFTIGDNIFLLSQAYIFRYDLNLIPLAIGYFSHHRIIGLFYDKNICLNLP
jgi:hypothetical protein